MSYSLIIEQALRVAAVAHAGQQRKGAPVPYFTHAAGVALILARSGFRDEGLLAAAILHDVVEDTDVSVEQLRGQFPEAVVALVVTVSERKTDPRGGKRPWEDRKRDHLQQIATAPVGARAIVLADKLHNLETMLLDLSTGGICFSAFHAPPDRVLWYYEQMIDVAAGREPQLEALAQDCRIAVERLRGLVPSTYAGE
jgi:(p)ppGpp synthase/HD superfamily hydrolase